jgi:IS5 family transposase
MSLRWNPPVELSAAEEGVMKRCKAKKLFVFLRLHRHELFDEALQGQLAAMYGAQPESGSEVVPPALLAMVTILQAAFGVSDADAVEDAAMNRRWQLVLGCLGAEDAPFSQGTLQKFRLRLIEHEMDKRLLDRTVELARKLGGFGYRNLRAAFDASPLFGAGRVEDTFNLLGHAAREVVRTASQRLALPVEMVAAQAGIPVLNASSVKAGLDVDWDSADARSEALSKLVGQVESLARWLAQELAAATQEPPLKQQLETLQRIIEQDTEPDPGGGGARRRVRQGVAKERQISICDPEMRHGRKSKASRVDGYKRHIAVDLDVPLICSVAVTPANRPESEGLPALLNDLATQGSPLVEALIDRGYLGAPEIEEQRRNGVVVRCKPFPLRNRGRYTKTDFTLDLPGKTATCPQQVTVPIALGRVAHFPAERCDVCPVRSACTTTKLGTGRSLSIHPYEDMHLELRATARTREGRTALRQRTEVEHRLAHIGQSQGRRARYLGLRKNLFDLRRHAAVANLHTARGITQRAA